MPETVVVVRFENGPPEIAGAVVELPDYRVPKLKEMRLSVSASGRLFDRRSRQYVPGAVVAERPFAQRQPKPPRRPLPSSNLALREAELPEHRPSRPRPPRSTVPTKASTAS